MENAFNSITELFKQNNPLAWVLGVLAILLVGAFLAKLFPKFTSKQALLLLIVTMVLVAGLFIFDKISSNPPNPDAPKPLTFFLYGPGGKDERPINDRGRIEIRDTLGNHEATNIDFMGKARFDSLPNWVFESKPGITAAFLKSSEDSLYSLTENFWHVKPNDTIFLELSKREPIKKKEPGTGTAPEITNNDVVLQFVTKHGTTPFTFDKRKKLKQLLEGLLKEAKNVLVLTHGQVAKLQVKGDTVPNTKMDKTIAQYGLKDGDDVSIGIESYVTFRKTYPKVTFRFEGIMFDKPSLYLNDNPVGLGKSSFPSNAFSVTEGIYDLESPVKVTMLNKGFRYTFNLDVIGKKSIKVDMAQHKGTDLKALRDAIKHVRVEPLRAAKTSDH